MVYESSTRRIYTSASPRPVISSSYSYSPLSPVEADEMYCDPNCFIQLPILPATAATPSARTYSYTISDPPTTTGTTSRRVESVTRTVRSSDSSLGGPTGSRSYTTTTESTTRDDGYGPRTSTFSSERSYGGPGGGSYFSTSSYKSPYTGNSFRHMSYK